jgi:hypothetical protein
VKGDNQFEDAKGGVISRLHAFLVNKNVFPNQADVSIVKQTGSTLPGCYKACSSLLLMSIKIKEISTQFADEFYSFSRQELFAISQLACPTDVSMMFTARNPDCLAVPIPETSSPAPSPYIPESPYPEYPIASPMPSPQPESPWYPNFPISSPIPHPSPSPYPSPIPSSPIFYPSPVPTYSPRPVPSPYMPPEEGEKPLPVVPSPVFPPPSPSPAPNYCKDTDFIMKCSLCIRPPTKPRSCTYDVDVCVDDKTFMWTADLLVETGKKCHLDDVGSMVGIVRKRAKRCGQCKNPANLKIKIFEKADQDKVVRTLDCIKDHLKEEKCVSCVATSSQC